MKKSDIIDAYCRIRKIDQTIPDEVLDFMKESALEMFDKLSKRDEAPAFPKYLNNRFAGMCKLTGKSCFNSHLDEAEHCKTCGGFEFMCNRDNFKETFTTASSIPKEKWGVHETHCCLKHGCKYGDSDCPVATGEANQRHKCEECKNPM